MNSRWSTLEKVFDSTLYARKSLLRLLTRGSLGKLYKLDASSDHSGPIKTPLLMDFLNTPEKLNRRLIHNPMGRFGEAVEQAKAVVFRELSCHLSSTRQ